MSVIYLFLRLICVCFNVYILLLFSSSLNENIIFTSQASRFECVSTLGPAAAPVRWRTATWQLFAARRSRRCDPTALNWSTWLLGTPRPIKVGLEVISSERFYHLVSYFIMFWSLIINSKVSRTKMSPVPAASIFAHRFKPSVMSSVGKPSWNGCSGVVCCFHIT